MAIPPDMLEQARRFHQAFIHSRRVEQGLALNHSDRVGGAVIGDDVQLPSGR